MLFDEVFPKWGPILACNFSTGKKFDSILPGRSHTMFYFLFGMPIKCYGSLEKIRVGREIGNTHITFSCLIKSEDFKY